MHVADTQAAGGDGPAPKRPRTAGNRATPGRRATKKPDPWTPVLGRIPILELSPQQPDDLWPAKAFDGEVVPFSATVFKEGHDVIDAAVVLTAPSGRAVRRPLLPINPGLGRWSASVQVDEVGAWTWHVDAWRDDWGTWLHDAGIKIPAGIDVELMFEEGARLLERVADEDSRGADAAALLRDTAGALRDRTSDAPSRWQMVTAGRVADAIAVAPIASLVTSGASRTLRVERLRAGYGSWYEFFPRSEGAVRHDDGSWTSGTFRTAAMRLPAIAEMGFDVVYIPPVHPIGTTNRKGPNNTLVAGPHDPGSPYGIGSAAGGHDAIHPDLGTEADFIAFLASARALKLEVALDIALQASPDHPWVTSNPEFFTTLADGTIAYAENPPKKYQDIYPLNFDNDPAGSYAEMRRIFQVWIDRGVRIFRIDNPHTKPLGFWERLIHDVNASAPDVIFLAEAFTRPPMMRGLAKVGFQQSYTYFTWRNTKEDLTDYLVELSQETADYMRPNFFVNTHDILTPYLQFGGTAAYKVRAAIAATSVPTWGIYSGYELIENVARPGSEENIDNEKYEYRPRDWAKASMFGTTLAPYIARLNGIRRDHPALVQLRNIHFHWTESEHLLAYSKHLDAEFTGTGSPDTIIVVANLDPHGARETIVHLDPTAFGRLPDDTFTVRDLITGARWEWGADPFVRLDPYAEPVHILLVED
ncbi:alpha-1,4-glucan--maltose-1-phosphate maltosyltransferase [uncultured Amnibacterium sp.]|uniref:alpha-1,4-glucan--maltose-1-phosphate maltosyltransferase n=1 Tax=uncultured Amnibacterium sp. TaxID=1631851 RepID=UPI0035CBFFD8